MKWWEWLLWWADYLLWLVVILPYWHLVRGVEMKIQVLKKKPGCKDCPIGITDCHDCYLYALKELDLEEMKKLPNPYQYTKVDLPTITDAKIALKMGFDEGIDAALQWIEGKVNG